MGEISKINKKINTSSGGMAPGGGAVPSGYEDHVRGAAGGFSISNPDG